MVMRRGQHTSRVLEAMQAANGNGDVKTKPLPDFMPDQSDLMS